jgi:hypothetical protein
VAIYVPLALALITGGEGNKPIGDPGWPKGAAAIFNVPSRIAWWEGPPFGGGEWHAENRGDAKTLSAFLADFAKIDVKSKQVVVHDGVGGSFWLNPNREPAKRAAARMDWSFTVWQPGNWDRLRKLPADLNPTDPKDAADGPPARIDVYTGQLAWANVTVPNGLKVVDERLEAHGYAAADGTVLEGMIADLTTGKPMPATVRIELIAPEKGGYRYTDVAKTTAAADGRWVLTRVPEGWYRIVIEADGYVPRVIAYLKLELQPRWHRYDSGLARRSFVAGRVTDEAGQPLPDVEVRLDNVTAGADGRYEVPAGATVRTGPDGRFRNDQVPVGRASVWLSKAGYVRPGLGQPTDMPKGDVELTMIRAGRVVVTVDFTGRQRPDGYIVRIEPEGGETVGKYGGSGNINDKDQMTFDFVPPGRYVVRGHPNPSSDDRQTTPMTIDVEGGKTAEVKLVAK